MIKRFIKDNRGQVLYAAIVAVMFIGMLSMLTLGLTLRNYQAAAQKQQRVTDYYAADAVAELIRIGQLTVENEETILIDADTLDDFDEETTTRTVEVTRTDISSEENVSMSYYSIKTDTTTIVTWIENRTYKSWEVSYHAVETQAEQQEPPIE